ncbi:MAG: NGG1p interacting factor NIF3 [Candidatus Levybacteria bacterium]|nr:NGG1p interacting factor NIF3 [Candidatus Levybacteria bacterium]
MTIQQIYDLAVEMGIKADPRGEKAVKALLEKRTKAHKDSSEKSKKYFDSETLNSPYSDSRILFGDPKTPVKKLIAGIDADVSEVLMVDRLNEKGEKIDLLITHHPEGHALSSLHEVMEMQVDMFAKAGVPVNVADALFKERSGEVQRRFNPLNHSKTVDAARIMNVPIMALHTIWDNMGNDFMEKLFATKTFDTAGEVLEEVQSIPEFVEAMKSKSGPDLVSGSPSSRAGKVVVSFTGGTNPSVKLYEQLAKAGVGTLVEMHVSEDALKKLRELHINVIDAGHMAADSIGANLFMDALEAKGVEIIPCSGFVRIKRKASK